MVLKNDDLKNIQGGKASKALGLGILFSALGTLLVGILDGFMRPLSCNA